MKHIIFAILLLASPLLMAQAPYYPITTIAEDFGANWCGGCQQAFAGLEQIHYRHHAAEFISTRIYTESGDLTNPDGLARFNLYEVFGIPTVIFNGKVRVEGSDDLTATGLHYTNALRPYLYGASPIKVEVQSFNPSSGAVSGKVTVVSPGFELTGAQIVLYLLENGVTAQDTRVLRQVLSQDISPQRPEVIFNAQFNINPSYDPAKLWAAAFVQMPDNNILNSASSLALPQAYMRAAMDWDFNIVQEPSQTNYLSEPFWIFNFGGGESFNARIDVEEAPEGWYFNYCDEEGNCFPGGFPMPQSIPNGSAKAFHLNLMTSGSGMAKFRWVISSDSTGEYSIPFRYYTSDLASSDDPLAPGALPKLMENYPNPFRSMTTLQIQSPKAAGSAIIDIYNIKGQRVDSLHLDKLSQGTNQIIWNAGSDLPAGIYFQKLRNTGSSAQKMLLVK